MRTFQVADAVDARGTRVTLAADGGIWVADRFWPGDSATMALPFVLLPLVPAREEHREQGFTDGVDRIMARLDGTD